MLRDDTARRHMHTAGLSRERTLALLWKADACKAIASREPQVSVRDKIGYNMDDYPVNRINQI